MIAIGIQYQHPCWRVVMLRDDWPSPIMPYYWSSLGFWCCDGSELDTQFATKQQAEGSLINYRPGYGPPSPSGPLSLPSRV